jgi:hypothetical protein
VAPVTKVTSLAWSSFAVPLNRNGRPRWRVLIAVWCLLVNGISLHALQAPPTEYGVKAAYLFNFARFTTWSAPATTEDNAAFGVCVLGHDPFGAALDTTVAGERIEGKPVVIRRITKPKDTVGCRVLFVSTSEGTALTDVRQSLDRSSILTVSDLPQFVERGGMIQFVLEGKRIRFAVNLPAAARAGLTLSAELLRVAVAVKTDPKAGA